MCVRNNTRTRVRAEIVNKFVFLLLENKRVDINFYRIIEA